MKPRVRVPATGVYIPPTPSIKIEPTLTKRARPKRPRRFKVQQRVELTAHDRSNKPFLLGEMWRTVTQADKQSTAERLMLGLKAETQRDYRIAEEWPIGSLPRPLK